MIFFTILFLILAVSLFEFFMFRQRKEYQKNLFALDDFNSQEEILKSLSYLLQSKQSLEEDWNQLTNILSTQNLYQLPDLKQFLSMQTNQERVSGSNNPRVNFSIAVENIARLLIKKHQLNQNLTQEQKKRAVSVKW